MHRARRPWEISIIRRSGDEQTKLHIFPRAYPAAETARLVLDWIAGVTVVGIVPEFEAECLAEMLGHQGLSPHWGCAVDVPPLAVATVRELGPDPDSHHEDLSRQCGVTPPGGAVRSHDRLTGAP